MANNTYVWVGSMKWTPRKAVRRSMAAAWGCWPWWRWRPRDGTRGYDASLAKLSNWPAFTSGTNLVAISKVQLFSGVHLAEVRCLQMAGLARPTLSQQNFDELGNSQCTSVTPFYWPIGPSG